MALWNYCAICGRRIEVGEPCLGIEEKNTEFIGDSICFDCAKIENVPGIGEIANIACLIARAETAEEIASELCDDFTDFVTGGVHNAAPYCANFRPECVNNRGWCNGDNKVCRGFFPKAARIKKEE